MSIVGLECIHGEDEPLEVKVYRESATFKIPRIYHQSLECGARSLIMAEVERKIAKIKWHYQVVKHKITARRNKAKPRKREPADCWRYSTIGRQPMKSLDRHEWAEC